MKHIEVAAAVIIRDDGAIFAAERGYGEFKDQWEFPGGKLEAGESAEDALKREIREELQSEIEIIAPLKTVDYDYPAFHITMHIFIAKLIKGSLKLIEHENSKWLYPDAIDSVEWLPADLEAIPALKSYLLGSC